MIGSLAEGLAEVVAGEVATQANRRQGEGSRYLHHGQQGQQQQRQQPAGPLAGFTESVSDACNRALVMALTVSAEPAHSIHIRSGSQFTSVRDERKRTGERSNRRVMPCDGPY